MGEGREQDALGLALTSGHDRCVISSRLSLL